MFEYYTFIRMILFCAGDVHPNPGLDSDSESVMSGMTDDTTDTILYFVSVVYYIKAIYIKLMFLKLSYRISI